MFRRKRTQGDFEAELQAHVEMEADRFREEGLSRDEALHAARRSFGNLTHAQERFYESGRWMLWENLRRDVRFAARVLAKDARFSLLAVLGLALGIGVSTGVFALVNLSLLTDSAETRGFASYVGLTGVTAGRPRDFSYAEYRYYQDRATSLRDMEATSGREHFILAPLSAGAEAQEAEGRFVSAAFLTAGGMHPTAGRNFTPAEESSGNPPVAVLDYSYWRQHFAANPDVVGKTFVLNAHPVTVIGVADKRIAGNTSQLYIPLALQPALLAGEDRIHESRAGWLMLEAWLRPGTNQRQSQAEMDVLAKAFDPAAPAGSRVLVSAGGPNPSKRAEMMAMAVAVTLAVSMILLIACSNLANLLLARAVVRRREIGARLALGASRLRLISQLLTESMLLALAGGALGLVMAYFLAKWAMVTAGADVSALLALSAGPVVVLYGILLSLATGLAFGLAPALAATRTNLAQALHSQSMTGAERDHRPWSPRNLLVIVPLAVSLMLLLGAGVAIRRMQNSFGHELPFDTSRLAGISLRLNLQGYDEGRTRQFQDDLHQRIAAIPGVESVALATALPLSNGAGWFPLVAEGLSAHDAFADYNIVTPNYFATVGAGIVQGRGFTPSDTAGSPPVALVNQDLVRRNWPNQPAIGKRIRLAGGTTAFEIVGIAPDLADATRRYNSVWPTVYVPYAQGKLLLGSQRTDPPSYQMRLLVRSRAAAAGLKPTLHQLVLSADPALRVDIQTLEEVLAERAGPLRTISLLLSALGALALIMASVGIYAILAYAVSQRTREIGIRTALGAQRREILALVMRRTSALIAWGICSGLFLAFVLTRVFARSMAKFGELDGATCLAVSLILGIVALLASYLPARKALRVDPAQALRCE